MSNQLLFAFGLYIAVLFAISFIFYRRNKNATGFMVGDRSLNYWVTAISAQASDMGPWLFLGYPATVFLRGSFEIWTALGLIFFMFLTWQYVAPAIRKATEEYNALTLWTYFEKRYDDHSGYLRALSACIALLFFVFYIASGLVSLGRIFETSFGLDYAIGVLIAVIATCTYIIIGGFLAVAWCNLFQGLFLLAMVLIVPIAAYFQLDGSFSIIHNAQLREISLSLFPSYSAFWQGLLLFAGWGLGYFGQPHIIVNFMAIDDPNNVRYAKWVGLIWQAIALGSSVAIGIIGIGLYSFRLDNHEALFPTMINDLFSPLLVGFILCGVFAAALSSITSQLLVAASSFAEDLYKKLFFPHAGSIQLLIVSKAAIIGIGAISTLLALTNTDTIYNLVFYAWSGLGCAFGPLMLLSLHSTYINRAGAFAAIISGTIVALTLPYIAPSIPSLVVGFTISTLSAYTISALTKKLS